MDDQLLEKLKELLDEKNGPVRITVGFLKGGSAKSTSAVLIAMTLARFSGLPVMLIDADGLNATTFEWSELAAEDWPAEITVHYWPSAQLAKRVRDTGWTGHIVIDTGPGDATVLRQALSVTDFLITPMMASGAEVSRLRPTLEAAAEVAALHPIEHSVLMTRNRANTRALREAKEALSEQLEVLGTDVPFKQLYSQAFGTVPDDLGAYPEVLVEILEGSEIR